MPQASKKVAQATPTAAQNVAANAAAQVPTTLASADLVAAANTAHSLGTVAAAYHGGTCPCLAKTAVPIVAANMVRAFVAKYANAKVVPTAQPTNYGTRGKPGGKRHNIVQAILAGGTVASIVAISKANGASFGGLADLVVLVWLGAVTLTK